MPVNSIDVPDVEATAVPDTIGYKLVVTPATCKVPANVAFCEAFNVKAVVPAPVPVLSSSMPVLSGVIFNPFVAFPAVIIVAMYNP
jgi:hypothetical protein